MLDDQDPYLDPKTGLLRNLVGATSQAQLDQIEVAFSSIRHLELIERPIVGAFDMRHLQAIHKHLFGDVYPWAGEIRTVLIDKGQTRFAMPHRIEPEGVKFFQLLAKDNHLKGLDAGRFTVRAARYMGEINVLHPFREGNGRTQRAFMSQLAREAGYSLTWIGITREEMTKACIEAFYGDSDILAGLIARNLTDLEPAQAYELAQAKAAVPVELTMAAEGGDYAGCVIGETSRYVVQEIVDQPGQVVLHRRSQLVAPSADLTVGTVARIRYPHGGAGLVEAERSAKAASEKCIEIGAREL